MVYHRQQIRVAVVAATLACATFAGLARTQSAAPLSHPKARILSEIAANDALMEAFGMPGTPGLVWVDAQRRAARAERVAGVPAHE